VPDLMTREKGKRGKKIASKVNTKEEGGVREGIMKKLKRKECDRMEYNITGKT